MEQVNSKKPQNKNKKAKHTGNGQPANKQGKKTIGKAAVQKERKGNRVKQQPISGFSTLSQVAGVPLARPYRSNIAVLPVKTVNEPHLTCPVCGEPIEVIAEAMTNAQGAYVHFDCVLNELKASETLTENQTISYLGSGTFGVCEKGEDGKYFIVKRIDYENHEKFSAMKNFVESLKS